MHRTFHIRTVLRTAGAALLLLSCLLAIVYVVPTVYLAVCG